MEELPDPVTLGLFAGVVGVLPFMVVMGTSFVKLVIVFSLLRNALGIQQIPPNMAVNGLALILTMYIMAPVAIQSYENMTDEGFTLEDRDSVIGAVSEGLVPYREFLARHVDSSNVEFFLQAARDLWPEDHYENIHEDNMIILLPAFVVGELTDAFEIGFLLYLPFIVVDLVISNILLAMGMMMVSPMTISLPFKLLLFVFLDGWTRLIHGLVLSYQ